VMPTQGLKLTFVAPATGNAGADYKSPEAHRKLRVIRGNQVLQNALPGTDSPTSLKKQRVFLSVTFVLTLENTECLGRRWPRLQHFVGRNSNLRDVLPPANFEPCLLLSTIYYFLFLFFFLKKLLFLHF